jgi:hypothetical protein
LLTSFVCEADLGLMALCEQPMTISQAIVLVVDRKQHESYMITVPPHNYQPRAATAAAPSRGAGATSAELSEASALAAA